MKISPTFLLLLIFIVPSLVSGEAKLSEQALSFAAGFTLEERSREAATMAPSDKARLIEEMRVYGQGNPAAKDELTSAMATLGDEKSLQEMVLKFLENDAASPGILGTMQSPRIIELVAPVFFRDEVWRSGGDVFLIPPSYRAAELTVEILSHSFSFDAKVANWARSLKGLTTAEMRAIIRPWWKENERFFREKNYKAVQPGPEPRREPLAGGVGDVEVPAPQQPRSPLTEPSISASGETASQPQSTAAAPPYRRFLISIVSIVALVTGLQFFRKRKIR